MIQQNHSPVHSPGCKVDAGKNEEELLKGIMQVRKRKFKMEERGRKDMSVDADALRLP